MKVNAPKKIYLFENPITETPDDRWLSKRSGDTDIEYIRTDAFIEKASRWIEENIKKWNENIKVHGFRGMTPLMIIEFKNYMKGE